MHDGHRCKPDTAIVWSTSKYLSVSVCCYMIEICKEALIYTHAAAGSFFKDSVIAMREILTHTPAQMWWSSITPVTHNLHQTLGIIIDGYGKKSSLSFLEEYTGSHTAVFSICLTATGSQHWGHWGSMEQGRPNWCPKPFLTSVRYNRPVSLKAEQHYEDPAGPMRTSPWNNTLSRCISVRRPALGKHI